MEITKERQKKSCKTNKCEHHVEHPSHGEHLPSLRRIEGQVRGVQNMIDEGRYCVDILVQMRALQAAIRSVESKIFETHLRNCVQEAFQAKSQRKAEEKIAELIDLVSKRSVI